jgi:hypothetical protein
MRTRDGEHAGQEPLQPPLPAPGLELPPGATFEPSPQGRGFSSPAKR